MREKQLQYNFMFQQINVKIVFVIHYKSLCLLLQFCQQILKNSTPDESHFQIILQKISEIFINLFQQQHKQHQLFKFNKDYSLGEIVETIRSIESEGFFGLFC